MATFADELKLSVTETWKKILNHKFINEIYNDTLPIDKFIFYLKQDQIFLDEFCRFLRMVKQKSDDNIDLVKLFDSILYSTVNFEMKMQDQIIADCSDLTSPSSDIRRNHRHLLPSKTTLEYIFYLRQVSTNGSMGECVSVIMPCPWTYLEIAQKLSKSRRIQDNQVFYKKWIRFYSSDDSYRQVNDLKKILCVLADDEEEADDKDKLAMKKHFATACRYELLFWDMAYGN